MCPCRYTNRLKYVYLDGLFKHIRARFGGYNVAKHSTAREVIKLKRAGKQMAIGLITDQSPNMHRSPLLDYFLESGYGIYGWCRTYRQDDGFSGFYCELRNGDPEDIAE